MKNTITLLILLFSVTSLLFAQNQSNFFLQSRVGISGDAKNLTPTYESFDTNYELARGRSWAAGIGYEFYPKARKNWGLKSSLLYENAKFNRIENYHYSTFSGDQRGGKITRTHTNQTLQNPLQIFIKGKSLGVSAGIITVFHLHSKFDQEHQFFLNGMDEGKSNRTYKTGTYNEFFFGDWERIDMERPLSWQWVVGFSFDFTSRWTIDLEYKNYFGNNQLEQEISNYDVASNFIERFDVLSQNLSLGLTWRFK